MLAVYLLIALVAVVRAAKVQYEYCQEMKLRNSTLRKDVVTMVYTMEKRCMLCYKEINRLFNLKTQMAKLGHNADILVGIDNLASRHVGKLPPEVTVDAGDVWEQLGKRNGHIFIFDKCGKFAYEVITPWSKQNHPFTAMAALSAMYDAPCGECNATSEILQELHEALDTETESAASQQTTTEIEEDLGKVEFGKTRIPFKIVIQESHQHITNGRTVTYDVIELRPGDPNFHGHGDSGAATTLIPKSVTESPSPENHDQTSPRVPPDEDYSDIQHDAVPQHKTPLDADEIKKLRKHYEPLMKWMSCAKQIMGIN